MIFFFFSLEFHSLPVAKIPPSFFAVLVKNIMVPYPIATTHKLFKVFYSLLLEGSSDKTPFSPASLVYLGESSLAVRSQGAAGA